ncbi:MAG: hypothetical protein H7177_07825 [Rhizobacter sp.]|nr:hypothetical protein [Bacteriovorax sp.]
MKLLLVLFFVSHSAFAIDAGDGSDGVCNITGGADTQITSARKTYQCTTLNLDGNLNAFDGAHAGAGGAPLVIKVQGDVHYTPGVIIDLSGDVGLEGALMPGGGAKAGGLAGAGGSAGGNSFGTGVNGTTAGNTGSAFGARGGIGGSFVTPNTNSSYGGGGGGGSFKNQGAVATDGDDVGGAGSIPGSGGANGAALGDETTLDTSFTGGAGGGAGGDGENNGTLKSGSSGGGGGGAIRIVAGGNITIDGTIKVNGGKGGGLLTTDYSGAGGGGSGGVIFLQAGGTLTITPGSTLEAIAGDGGDNDIGPGGFGGDGMIRLDDGDGLVSVAGSTVTPVKYTAPFTPSPLVTNTTSLTRQYTSGVSCGSVALDDHEKPYNNVINLMLGVAIAALFHLVVSKKSKV